MVMAVRREVERLGPAPIAVTAKLNMADGVRGGISIEESLQTAKWLQDDGGLDALELTAGSSLLNPMYLFRGDAPVKEFAAAQKWPLNWGMRMTGTKFMREYPYRDTYLLRDAQQFRKELTLPLILLGGITNRETHGHGDGRGLRVRGDGSRPAGRAGPDQPDQGRRRRALGEVAVHALQQMHADDLLAHDLRGDRRPGLTGEAPRYRYSWWR